MGTCQSCCAADNTEDFVLATKGGRDLPKLDTKGNHPKHQIFDLLSPTWTEATTPASTCTLITPKEGPLSLSMISTSSLSFVNQSERNEESGRRKASKFSFDTPAQIDETMEEEDGANPNASSDEEEDLSENGDALTSNFACAMKPNQDMTIMNPPLVAPPKGQADILWQNAKSRGSVNDRMVRDFNRFKRQATLAERQEKQRKKQEKTTDRLQDIKSYRSLWDQFVELEKLSASTDQQNSASKKAEQDSEQLQNDGEYVGSPAKKIERNASKQKHRNKRWNMPRKEDDDTTSQKTTVSLLSDVGMESQRILQEARYAARKLTKEQQNKPKPVTKDFDTIMEENSNDCAPAVISTPLLSPPRLEVITNESKSTIIAAYNKLDSTTASLTDIEVLFDNNDEKKKDDDTSGITHEDFDSDSWFHRRSRVSQHCPREDDMSSCVSYGGEVPTRLKFGHGEYGKDCENPTKDRTKRKLFRSMSHGVEQLAEMDENADPKSSKAQSSLGNRISHVERKVQAFQATRDNGTQNTASTESLRVVGVAPDDDVDERQSPASCELASAFNMEQTRASFVADDLEPTKLEQMFDSSELSPGNVREKIVLRNATKCQRQSSSSHQYPYPCPSRDISLMSTEEFRSMSVNGHAWVQVSRCPVNGSYRYQESSSDECCQARDTQVSSTPNASDIADEVGAVLSKFKGNDNNIVDVHEMFLRNGSLDSEDFGDDVQGNLFSA